ncbi:hypothetical protein [Desulfobacter hydrogenophilus]|nr:hypothetical protein [Desulfobacter hydrogenophilus]NDY74288.1 hypothetical protein [Desulfobacter hydrogenophilus]QBH15071.1 hypothetical protein EYB58_20385 [Desulfobacter hydrogenophilus]
MNPGETFSFYSFILGLFLINPQKMMENSSHPVTLKQLKIASIVFVLCYFFTAMWGEYYFVTNINAHKNMILGFIWPHGFGYFTALLGMILVANGAPFFALMIMFCGLLVGSRTAFLVTLLGIIYLIIYILRFVDEPSNFKKRVAFRGLLILIMSMGSFGIFFFVWVHYDDIFFLQRMVLTFSLIEFDVDFSSPAWVELTSGRSIFWSQITEYFFEKNRISGSWIWGLSPEIIRILNKNSFGLSIWMHNDWLQALYAFGFLGFIFYVVGIIRFITRLNFSFFALSFVLFTSILNGLYPYMGISILYLLAFYQAKLENKTCDE